MNSNRSLVVGVRFKALSWTLAGIVGSGLIACSATTPADESTEEPFNDRGTLFVPASPQTYAELGVANWVSSGGGFLGLDQANRIKCTAWFPTEDSMRFFGEQQMDLEPFAEGTTAAKALERAAADLRAAAGGDEGQQDVQARSVTSSLSPQDAPVEGNREGCKLVKGMGVRGTPMSRWVCPDSPPPSRPWTQCTQPDGRCPISGKSCRACEAPQPQAREENEEWLVDRRERGENFINDFFPELVDAGASDEPPAENCQTPAQCAKPLANHRANLLYAKDCPSCWSEQISKDVAWLNDPSMNCFKCEGSFPGAGNGQGR